MAFTSSTFLSDTIKFIRDDLDSNITDPITAKRSGRDRFVMTSYPSRPVKYPIITVRATNINIVNRLGMQSEGVWTSIPVEIRVWARNQKEKDELSQEVFNRLRSNQFGSGSTVEFDIHDFTLNSSVDVDEDGENAPKSRVMEYEYKLVIN